MSRRHRSKYISLTLVPVLVIRFYWLHNKIPVHSPKVKFTHSRLVAHLISTASTTVPSAPHLPHENKLTTTLPFSGHSTLQYSTRNYPRHPAPYGPLYSLVAASRLFFAALWRYNRTSVAPINPSAATRPKMMLMMGVFMMTRSALSCHAREWGITASSSNHSSGRYTSVTSLRILRDK